MDIDTEKLSQRVGVSEDELREVLSRLGPVQSWVFERLMSDADADPWPPWIPISELAAEYAGGRPRQPQVDSIRRACTRLEKSGLVETAQHWIERGEPRRNLLRLRKETVVKRRHLCVRLPLDAAQRERCESQDEDRSLAAGQFAGQ